MWCVLFCKSSQHVMRSAGMGTSICHRIEDQIMEQLDVEIQRQISLLTDAAYRANSVC
eukprot:m.242062 g.242062  ORF g.242062 m.242062 type:complete len:58 (+) comp17132_c0_seq3:1949-2122(+)